MTKTAEDQDLFMQCNERGTMLLSSDGLYNPSMVQKLAAHFMQPEDVFTSQEPGKALFSFYQQAIELAAQFGKLAPHLDKARKGQKPYPMGAIARLAGRLFCLTLHPCVDQGDPKWAALLNDFRQALNVQDPQAVAAVMVAVEWMRTHILERIRAEARDEDFHVSLEAVNAAKTKLEGIGSTGSAVGMCMGHCAMYFTVLMDGVATGKLNESGKHFSLPREMATSQPDGPLLTTALMFLTVIFGARGGWQEWRTDTQDLGEVLDESIPADLASGVLMQWDGVTLLPFIPDWCKGKVQPEFVAQMEQAHEAFSSNGHVVRGVALHEPERQEDTDGLYTKEELEALLAGFDVRGNDLLSTRGLYRDDLVKAIVANSNGMPEREFDNDASDTAIFNFYLHTIVLAKEIDAMSGKLAMARYGGEDEDGNEATYPMTDVARIGALLTNLVLHRAVEPFIDDRTQMLTHFCGCVGMKDTSTVTALCNAVNWLRGLMVQRYRSFVQGKPVYPSHDDINQVRELLADMGQGGDYIGLALGFTIANLLTLMAGAESGKVVDGVNLPIKMSEEQASGFSDSRILDVLLNTVLRRYFGARAGWQHWPTQDGDLGEAFPGAIPANLEGGVLMQWDDATLVPFFWDWYREHSHQGPSYIMEAGHRRWLPKQPIAVALYPLV